MTAQEVEVAARLRSLAGALHSGVVSDENLSAAITHLVAAERLLGGGEPRRRWYEVEASTGDRARNRELSPWSGILNAASPPMVLETGELDDGRPALIGRARLDRMREGPPQSAHGGVVAGLFDEVMGAAQRLTRREGGVTARLTIRYRKLTPLDTDLVFRAWIEDDRTRRVVVKADCLADGSGVTAQAEAVFVRRAR